MCFCTPTGPSRWTSTVSNLLQAIYCLDRAAGDIPDKDIIGQPDYRNLQIARLLGPTARRGYERRHLVFSQLAPFQIMRTTPP